MAWRKKNTGTMEKELNNMLIDAAIYGNFDHVEELLERGADIHAKDDLALRSAAEHGHTKIAVMLLGRKANVHAADGDALYWAALNGHKEMVELLIGRGIDIHANCETGLHAAALHGHAEIVELLLNRGADIHAEDDRALRWAAAEENLGSKATTLLLLRHGADPGVKNSEGKDSFEGTKLAEWLIELKQETAEYFKSAKPLLKQSFVARWLRQEKQATAQHTQSAAFLRDKCFTADKLHDKVLNACLTDQFASLIGAPLIASTDKADRQLFQNIWDALAPHWQDQNQEIYMQFIKAGGVNPSVAPHTAVAYRDSESPGSRGGR